MRPWEPQPWAEPYRAALLEFDRSKLSSRIETARRAIDLRIAELWCSSSARYKDTGEMGALQDALHVLRSLEKQGPLGKKTA